MNLALQSRAFVNSTKIYCSRNGSHYPYATECTYKLQPHSQALDSEVSKLCSTPSHPIKMHRIARHPLNFFIEKNAFTWRLGQMSKVLLILSVG